jgi:hypothetical protein
VSEEVSCVRCIGTYVNNVLKAFALGDLEARKQSLKAHKKHNDWRLVSKFLPLYLSRNDLPDLVSHSLHLRIPDHPVIPLPVQSPSFGPDPSQCNHGSIRQPVVPSLLLNLFQLF